MPVPVDPTTDRLIGAGLAQAIATTSLPFIPSFVRQLATLIAIGQAPTSVPQNVYDWARELARIKAGLDVSPSQVLKLFRAVADSRLAGDYFSLGQINLSDQVTPGLSEGYGPNYPVASFGGDKIYRILTYNPDADAEHQYRTFILPGPFTDLEDLRNKIAEEIWYRSQVGRNYPGFITGEGGLGDNVEISIEQMWAAVTTS